MKKDIFNFRRFGKYFASDAKTCTANYGLSLITLSILSFLALYVFCIAFNLLFGNVWDGPDTGLRFFVFAVVMICIFITMPVKCYGKLTEKQYGSQWLMIPASKLEKFASMLIFSCIIVPVMGALLYLSLDALICAVDHTCGSSLISWIMQLDTKMNELIADDATSGYSGMADFIDQLKSPWLYIDDFFGLSLPFLLGAMIFKNGKTVKTFLALAAIGTLASMAASALSADYIETLLLASGTYNPETTDIETIFDIPFMKHVALYDTISDTVVNCALLIGIYFRIKTLKH